MKNKILIISVAIFIAITGCKQNTGNNENDNIDSYVACGCGCCGDADPEEKCIYHSEGDLIDTIIENDKSIAASENCIYVGCSLGIKYIYCD